MLRECSINKSAREPMAHALQLIDTVLRVF